MNLNQYPIKVQVDGIDPDVYCPEIWNRAYINQLNDQFDYKPCCYYQSPREAKKLLTDFNSIYNDYNQSDFATTLRDKNKNSIPDAGCNHCYNLDKINPDASGRVHALKSEQNRLLGNHVEVTTHIDLNLGNLCNLSCAICGPYNSSNWVPVYEKGWSIVPDELRYKKKNRQAIDDPALFLSLKTVQLQGGEIFMEPGYYHFFNNLGKYRTYDDLSVWIFTNGTTLPTPEFMDILNNMGKVRIFFSVDDIEHRFEYQRRGAAWDEVSKNIDWFQENAGPNFELSFNITYSLYNIYYLRELQECLSTRFSNVARRFTPFNSGLANCSANRVTSKIRDAVLSKTSNIPELNFLNSYMVEDDTVSYKEFLDYVAKYDGITATSYAESHSEFYNLLVNI
jgi:MoaA/NifB/PqqE/SkfB family radical SAM enzyme